MGNGKGGAWCAAINCKNNFKSSVNCNFFRFPSDTERCKRWVINCRRDDLLKKTTRYLYDNCRLCSQHFELDQILFLPCGRSMLIKNAVPTLFDFSNKSPLLSASQQRFHQPLKRKKKNENLVQLHIQLPDDTRPIISSLDPKFMEGNDTDVNSDRQCEVILPHITHRDSVIIKMESTDTSFDEENDIGRYDNPTDGIPEINCEVTEPFETIKCEIIKPFETIKCEVIEPFETIKHEVIDGFETNKCDMIETHTELIIKDENKEDTSYKGENDMTNYENITDKNSDTKSQYVEPLETCPDVSLEADIMLNKEDSSMIQAHTEQGECYLNSKQAENEDVLGPSTNLIHANQTNRQVTQTNNKIKDEFFCSECIQSFTEESHLNKHMCTHNAMKDFSCNKCGKSFSYKSYLNPHVSTDSVKQFFCIECSQSSPTHKLTHSMVRDFFCSVCGNVFISKYTLNKHMLKHKGVKYFSCNKCDYTYTSYLNALESGVQQISCIQCNETLIQSNRPTLQIEKQFACSECSKTFFRRCHLNEHKLVHTGVKLFSCTECSKSFSNRSGLRQHIFIHTGVKRITCPKCDKSFTRQYYFNHHILIHSCVKKFSCTECSKVFTKKSHLNKHMLIHAGAKRFSCTEYRKDKQIHEEHI